MLIEFLHIIIITFLFSYYKNVNFKMGFEQKGKQLQKQDYKTLIGLLVFKMLRKDKITSITNAIEIYNHYHHCNICICKGKGTSLWRNGWYKIAW